MESWAPSFFTAEKLWTGLLLLWIHNLDLKDRFCSCSLLWLSLSEIKRWENPLSSWNHKKAIWNNTINCVVFVMATDEWNCNKNHLLSNNFLSTVTYLQAEIYLFWCHCWHQVQNMLFTLFLIQWLFTQKNTLIDAAPLSSGLVKW